ncbi:adenosine deaminase-like isoform X2 [Lytechinus variegatus]|uniref:adenosine deaminase-like isoform X2 n=1 Tax=Lytechinus variegatus TaxID=7654 RepID=UPI001BB232EC|nr:adenosine deaminase-like isoform X2 [Lytechinus variegatus]
MAQSTFTDRTFPKVELHLHIEGAIRSSTIWEISQKRGISVGCSSLEELEKELVEWKTGDLSTFLAQFNRFMPVFIGDLESIKRISYELCEDLSKEGAVYFEARYSPHLFSNLPRVKNFFNVPEGDVTPRDVVRVVNEGIREGSKDFGIQARTVLCMIRDKPEWSAEVLELCEEFHNDTVVGIDLANNEMLELYTQHIEGFKGAKTAGIHRTCHAGEMGPASNVQTAIEILEAERIGHGYHIFDDESVVKLAKEKSIHFEVCPTSSTRTGALEDDFDNHCAKRFLNEGMNISINTDDPTLFGATLTREFSIARNHFGMDDRALALMTLNAAQASFLPDDQKAEMIKSLKVKFKEIL